jgi:hypothetical protein
VSGGHYRHTIEEDGTPLLDEADLVSRHRLSISGGTVSGDPVGGHTLRVASHRDPGRHMRYVMTG